MNLGENIFQFRSQCNLSQGDLANELGVSRQSVSKWENNSSTPELDKLIKMAKTFHISLDELVGLATPVAPAQEQAAAAVKEEEASSIRTTIGFIVFIFGLVSFLLSVFFGNHLRIGEALGELISASIVILGLALLLPFSLKVFSVCAVAIFLYSLICFGFLSIYSTYNYIFIFLATGILLVWFLVLGLHHTKGCDEK